MGAGGEDEVESVILVGAGLEEGSRGGKES